MRYLTRKNSNVVGDVVDQIEDPADTVHEERMRTKNTMYCILPPTLAGVLSYWCTYCLSVLEFTAMRFRYLGCNLNISPSIAK